MSSADAAPSERPSAPAGPPRARSWGSRLARRLTLLLVSCLVAGVLAELVVRWLFPQPTSWLDIFEQHPALPTHANRAHVDLRVDTGETHWRIVTDASGFRVRGGGPSPPPSSSVVLCLGDSFTFGAGVDYEESFVGLLDGVLSGRRSVVNTASPGYGPTQYRSVLDHQVGLGARPGFVLVGVYVGNDFYDCIWDKTFRKDAESGGGGVKGFLKRNSHAYRLLSRNYHAWGGGGPQEFRVEFAELYRESGWSVPPLSDAEPIFREEFRRIKASCDALGADLFVVVIPTPAAVGAQRPGDAPAAMDLPCRRAMAAMSALGIHSADATPALAAKASEGVYFRHDGHLNVRGHAVVLGLLREQWPRVLVP